MKKISLWAGGMSMLLSSTPVLSYQYENDGHVFTIPTELYSVPVNQVTLPGTHNSFNLSGDNPDSCAPENTNSGSTTDNLIEDALNFFSSASDIGPNDNKNVHQGIGVQIKNMGIRFIEIDVYQEVNGNWCVYHGAGGKSYLDGNNYYFSDIVDEIADAVSHIGKDPLFIKVDGKELTYEKLEEELTRVGLLDAVYRKGEHEVTPPSINELYAQGKRIIFVSGPMGWNWNNNIGTAPSHKERSAPFTQVLENPNNADFVRWNAFALDDTFGFGSTGDADYVHARLIPGGLEKWVQAGHRISHLNVDFPGRESVNMTAMRAANIFNQIPSIKGTVENPQGEVIEGVSFRYWTDSIDLGGQVGGVTWEGYGGKTIHSSQLAGVFDFPRPHGQAVRIEPYKAGYRFEPTAIYVESAAKAKNLEVSFKGYMSKSPSDVAERYSYIYKEGEVTLEKGLDVVNGKVVVNDVTRLDGFALTNKDTGLCITASVLSNGSDAKVEHCDGSLNQQWVLNPESGEIKTLAGNYCLDSEGHVWSGDKVKVYECNGHLHQKFGIQGQTIYPHHGHANGFDSAGRSAGTSLILWNRSTEHDHRNWVFERHYSVSSTGQNIVTDPSSDNKDQYFMLASKKDTNCLAAYASENGSPVKVKQCTAYGALPMENFLWKSDGKKFVNKTSDTACLNDKGQVWNDTEPHMWSCIDNHPDFEFDFIMPYWGGAASTVEPAAIHAEMGIVLDHPRDDFVRLYEWGNYVPNQGWILIPISNAVSNSSIRISTQYNSDLCLDVYGNNSTSNGENVQTFDCNYVSERWNILSGGKLQAAWNPNVCLDVGGYNPTHNGANIGVWNCNDVSETWTLGADGKFRANWAPHMCMDVSGINSNSNGSNVQLWNCNEVETWAIRN